MLIHESPLPIVEIPTTSITAHVLRTVDSMPDRVAIAAVDGSSSYTFSELDDAIHRFAGALVAGGFHPGDTLGIMAPNVPEYAVVFHGTAVAGGTVTTINPTYGAGEVATQLHDAGATILVTLPAFLDVARRAIQGTSVEQVIVIGGGGADGDDTDFAQMLTAEPIGQVPIDVAEDVVVLPYSSGTTGLPKGVMLTHRNLVANIEQVKHTLTYGDDEVVLAFLPFFHIYGMQMLMNGLLSNGVTVLTMQRFDMVEALESVQRDRVTRFFAVPPIILGLANAPIVDDYDLSSLIQVFSGAAPLGWELAEKAAERVGCEVVQGYGMTELSPASHITPAGDYQPGTSGVTISNTESRFVDPETGEDVGIGERGELWVRGPQVMKGYLNNLEETAEMIDAEGWLHTGDIAIIDEHQHVTIVDRLKELIKYKAFQVPPAELESLIITHPAVHDVAVIGVPDDEAGEIPKAFIVTAPGATLGLAELQEFIAGHLAPYKQVRQLQVVDEIPKSASGKILRRELRDA